MISEKSCNIYQARKKSDQITGFSIFSSYSKSLGNNAFNLYCMLLIIFYASWHQLSSGLNISDDSLSVRMVFCLKCEIHFCQWRWINSWYINFPWVPQKTHQKIHVFGWFPFIGFCFLFWFYLPFPFFCLFVVEWVVVAVNYFIFVKVRRYVFNKGLWYMFHLEKEFDFWKKWTRK